jgi:hypothetical protein
MLNSVAGYLKFFGWLGQTNKQTNKQQHAVSILEIPETWAIGRPK